MKVKLYLRNKNSLTATPINVKLSWKNKTQFFGTGIKVKPNKFLRDGKISSTVENAVEKNQFLKNRMSQIDALFYDFFNEKGREPNNGSELSKYINEKEIEKKRSEAPSIELLNFFEMCASEKEKELRVKGKDITRNNISNTYRQTAKLLKEFSNQNYVQIKFSEITMDFYYAFVDFCMYEKDYSTNNIGKHIKTLKTILNRALEDNLTDNLTHKKKAFKVLEEEVDTIYLSRDELNGLEAVHMEGDEDSIRDVFLMCCDSGLRLGDALNINPGNIDENGRLRIKTSKTGFTVVIPKSDVLNAILKKYKNQIPYYSSVVFNRKIKKICRKAGIIQEVFIKKSSKGRQLTIKLKKYELVSSHTGRRSFATNAYLAEIPTLDIMAITGHRTEKSFLKYIKVSKSQFAEKIEAKMNLKYRS